MGIFSRKHKVRESQPLADKPKTLDQGIIVPGRQSVPNDPYQTTIGMLSQLTNLVTPTFRDDIIPLIRDLYKVNPDLSIATQDVFKLTNTSFSVSFPNNTDKESMAMRAHLNDVDGKLSRYTAGIYGLINKLISQVSVGGAMSFECVPNEDLTGIETIVLVNPEEIRFQRENNGVYVPYQKVKFSVLGGVNKDYVKLNPLTYLYISMYNDTDEPYGIPPYMASLDSVKTQSDMQINFKQVMENLGLLGFLQVSVAQPGRKGNESDSAYTNRLSKYLVDTKRSILGGMKDGVVVGFDGTHSFKLDSTTKDLGNLNIPWDMNQQRVANGLGINSSIIGAGSGKNTQSSSGIIISKMIAQLNNMQQLLSYAIKFIYSLELRLAGFNCKGIKVKFSTTTVSDEVKVQQGLQYKIQNLKLLYDQGIISQQDFAEEMGYEGPDEEEPRAMDDLDSSNPTLGTKQDKRQSDKSKSDRKTRDKNNPSPKRNDQDSKPR